MAVLLANQAAAQLFGGNPPSQKWQQVNTDTVRVIFPKGMDAQGRRVADLVQHMSRYNTGTLGTKVKKINIILQHQTLQSNGYVQQGPFRSEFYITPPPNSTDLGSINWVDQLALHEYRHVVQNNNFNKGVSKVFSILGGELGQGAANGVAVPDWFWEGDAVTMETALSLQGRGRLPAFFDGFRALTLADKDYTYMQVRNGSLRKYMPNHYNTGYLMSSYGRLQYGTDFWKGVTDDAVCYRGVFYPFSQSLKRRTGKNAAAFFAASLDYYKKAWEPKEHETADTLTPAGRTVSNYRYVYAVDDSTLIYLYNSYKQIASFKLRHADGREELITRPGIGFDDYFSYRNGRILWTESRYDPRWNRKDYSIVKVFDRNTGKTMTLNHARRVFSPDLSHDGKMIVVNAVTPEQRYQLEILDANTGEVRGALVNPANWYYTYPKFTGDDQYIISAVRNQQGKMALIRQKADILETDKNGVMKGKWRSYPPMRDKGDFSIGGKWGADPARSTGDTATDQVLSILEEAGEIQVLIPFGNPTIGISSIKGDMVYFQASFGDADNVYAIPLNGGPVQQVTHRPNGVSHMAVQDNKIIFSEFTAEGYKLLRKPLEGSTPFDPQKDNQSAWLKPDLGEEGNILDKVPVSDLKARKYAKTHRLFNFHSWIPSINDPEYGLYLYGDNVLGTLQTAIGAYYNTNENSPAISGSLTYAGLFPYLRTGADYRMDRYLYVNDTVSVEWNELDWFGGMSIPLTFSAGKYLTGLTIGGNYHEVNRKRANNSKYRFRDSHIQYLDLSLGFSNQRIKALQNIYSHFGQSLSVRYNKSVNNVPAEQIYGRLDLYLPGFSANHSIVLQGAFQQRDTMLRYSFTDNFVYARGYNKPFYESIWKVGANYHFPIVYPDWGFANLLYFTRIRGNVFYDYSSAYNFRSKQDVTYASTGAELFFDTKIGNTLPFTIGVRYSYLLNTNPGDPSRKDRFEVTVPLQQLFAF
ncbi:hypothetical protein EG028_09820 [Chitinophaga barathri]|uniref:Uncharacterized protein n=1 Tax=Chitinophaga barathri TaxID=1647451 RepID=A0A3N4MCL6_9BACT|nr:hypothetical protein EG028_09820 [Chitinophaga barathri]